MSDLSTYIKNASAAGTEVATMTAADLAGKVEALALETCSSTALLAGFEKSPELLAAIVSGLQKAGVRIVNSEEAALADLGVTHCETLVADTGSLSHDSFGTATLTASLLPKVHLAVGRPVNLHPDLKSLLAANAQKMPARLALITGPSRTGDIEATMTKCVHGPGRVIHYIIDRPA